ncbi:unnamed protein product [Lactuca saligna]|uniref:Leucine-rich repeat-containing N-terminal plant-type domain-containing protein n=1 Tax=Lactuca saligna TaxID=75948 RepID=A0AA36EJP3_LACSI|nr:unnamed protein product [Lactuca saligna]
MEISGEIPERDNANSTHPRGTRTSYGYHIEPTSGSREHYGPPRLLKGEMVAMGQQILTAKTMTVVAEQRAEEATCELCGMSGNLICMTSIHTQSPSIHSFPFQREKVERELNFFCLSSLQLSNISLTFPLFFTSSRLNWICRGFVLIFVGPISLATNPADVSAINKLYVALGSPLLPGWTASAGDPCIEGWQGVACDPTNTNILSITVIGANIVGELGESLGSFTSLQSIDLSNNHIGGSIPTEFPVTIMNMSLNDNNLSGEIPDSFEGLTGLVNLDLSSNDLSGELPSSLQHLSFLTTFHLQNNQLSGTLDVLQDLPLTDLNVENNMFNGPIPEKLLAIPIFRKDGNLFNTTSAAPLSPPTSPIPLTPPGTTGTPFFPSPRQTPGKQSPPGKQTPSQQADGPSSNEGSKSSSTNKSWSSKKKVWVSIASIFGFIVLGLLCLLFIPPCFRRKRLPGLMNKRHEIAPYNRESHMENGPLAQPPNQVDKAPPKEGGNSTTKGGATTTAFTTTTTTTTTKNSSNAKIHRLTKARQSGDRFHQI